MREVHHRFEVEAPWELAIVAYDRKSWSIPSPEFKEILRCDFDEWDVDLANETTRFRRSVQLIVPAPQWLLSMITSDKDMWYEFQSVFDRKNKIVEVVGRNKTLCDFMSSEEHMRLVQDPVNAQRCILTYRTTYNVHATGFLKGRTEALITKLYSRALKKGRQTDKKYIDAYRKQKTAAIPALTRSETYGRELLAARKSEAQIQRKRFESGQLDTPPGSTTNLNTCVEVVTVDDLCVPVRPTVSKV